MCGIAGFTLPRTAAAQQIETMLAAIRHRGPDGAGVFVDQGVALGHCRLAVIDPYGGAQPRVDAASGDALVFNGEIYGFRDIARTLRNQGVELRDACDTEVLFQLIRRDGVRKAVEQIDGMFAFAYRDGATGDLTLARDRFGEKPLYYGIIRDQLVFGSEAGAIMAHPAFRYAAPDLAAAYQLLQFEYVPGRASGWTGISKLRPGTLLRFAGGRAELIEYWRPQVGSARTVPETDAVATLNRLLHEAVDRQSVADVPLGVFLSGGLDSSLLTALAARINPDITAFTVQVGGRGFDESPYATDVARFLGVRHEVVRLDDADVLDAVDDLEEHLSEPLADSSLLPTWLVCRAARQHMTVALGGDGADELFAGYPNFHVQRFASLMRLLPPASGAAMSGMLARMPAREAGDDGYMNMRFRLAQLSQGFGQPTSRQSLFWMAPFGPAEMAHLWADDIQHDQLQAHAFAAIEEASTGGRRNLDRLLGQFLMSYLPDNILMKTDRASMFNGLEVRAPFLDRGFADYACALPSGLKLRNGVSKYALKQVARRYLPDRIVDRKKHGFAVPIGRLLRTLLRERCTDTVLSRSNPVTSWFNHERLEQIVQEHMAGTRDHGKRLWSLYVLFNVAGRQSEPRETVRHLHGAQRMTGTGP